MRRMAFLAYALSGVALLSLAIGCQAPAQPSGPTVDRLTAAGPDEFDLLWEAVGDTLREMDFRLDRQDRANGMITTFPETTAQALELWRPQPRPAYYWAEANLHTIQRKVTVKITSTASGEYDLDVTVERFRYRLEERQIDNSAAALRLYSSDAPTVSGRSPKLAESTYWIPLGRDGFMEERVLADILKRYRGSPLASAEPAS